KGIIAITKKIQKITLHPTAELFKERLESYVEKHSREYIKDIRKYRWDSHFYSEYMTIISN
ncbi:9667_t:CDS:1, partial [Funneliformis caledonium]